MRVTCDYCGKRVDLRADGTLAVHKALYSRGASRAARGRSNLYRCPGSGMKLYSANPGYELRHYVVELKQTGEPLRTVKIGKRDWTPDWAEATAVAGEMMMKHPRAGGFEVVSEPVYAKKNPGEARWPAPVEKIVELIWAIVSAHPDPDLAELNPVVVEHNDRDSWTVGFDENVILYGWNDGYTYNPKKRTWRVYLGDTGKTRIRQTTAQVEARVRQLLSSEAMSNPGGVWWGKNLPRVRHRDHGVGRVEGFAESSSGDRRVLAFVRWAESSGAAGGWYDLASESFMILDVVRLRQFFTEWQQGLL